MGRVGNKLSELDQEMSIGGDRQREACHKLNTNESG